MADSATPTYDKLKPKQQAFVDHYLKCSNATEAARLAGYSGSDNTLRVTGGENLLKPAIQAALRERGANALQGRMLSADEVLQRIGDIATKGLDERNRLAALNSLKKRFRIDNDPELDQLTREKLREETTLLRMEREDAEKRRAKSPTLHHLEGRPYPQGGPGAGVCGLYHSALDPNVYPDGKLATEGNLDPAAPCVVCGAEPWRAE